VVSPLQDAADLLKRLAGDDEKEQQAAADALVKKGSSARAAVAKAWDKAAANKKSRFEDVLLRIDAGTDQSNVTVGPFTFQVRECAWVQEIDKEGKAQLRLKVVFEGSTIGESAVTVTLAKSTFYTAKDKMTLLVVGAKGEAFSRKFDPMVPKMFEYGSLIPPRWPPGTRGVAVFEVEFCGKKYTLRSPIAPIEKKE